MDNVKFVRCEEKSRTTEYFFKINERLADFVRKNTNYRPGELNYYLSGDNLFKYVVGSSGETPEMQAAFTETVEKISNVGNEAYFYNHLITKDGCPRGPAEIHKLMHDEYGLIDIDKAEEEDDLESSECELEWMVAHFFIAFNRLLFDEPHSRTEDEMAWEADSEVADIQSVSDILNNIKSIDTIVIVDDARKIGLEDVKRIVVDDDIDMLNTLLYKEIPDRGKLFYETFDPDGDPVLSLSRFNSEMERRGTPERKIPRMLVLVDDPEKLMKKYPEEAEEAIYRLEQLGDGYGIHLVVGQSNAKSANTILKNKEH